MVLSLLKPRFPVIPGHKLHEKIGKGASGAVYKGSNLENGQNVAIKVIPSEAIQDAVLFRRFEQEFQAASKLRHPNIVQVFDFGRDQTDAYVVMEYVDGINLGRSIRRAGRLAEDEAVAIITQVAHALQYAHERGLVHRDVKPANILVRADGQAKLADFGLVKDLLVDTNMPLSILANPQFMSPEQYQNPRDVDARADLYSLAATLYVAVTGALPFGTCKSYVALMERILRGTITPPRQVVPSLSTEIDTAIRRGMSPDPGKRPSSCLEFAHSLNAKKSAASAAASQAPDNASTAPTERRACLRYSCGMGSFCVVSTSGLAEDARQDAWPASIQNISKTGLGLVLALRLERDTVLTLELTAPGKESSTLLAHVIRVQAQGFGHWYIGCRFLEPLSDETLQALVGPADQR